MGDLTEGADRPGLRCVGALVVDPLGGAAEVDELDAFAFEPLHQAPAVLGHGPGQVLPRGAVGRGGLPTPG